MLSGASLQLIWVVTCWIVMVLCWIVSFVQVCSRESMQVLAGLCCWLLVYLRIHVGPGWIILVSAGPGWLVLT